MFQFRLLGSSTLAIVAALAVLGCSSDSGPRSSGVTGSLSLTLLIEGDTVIDSVDWEITGGDMEPMSGTVDTSAPGATASVEVFGLPPTTGDDYTITMTASASDGTTCEGSADFGIDVGQVTGLMVFLNCKRPERLGGVRVNGKLNVCAELAKVIVSPLQTSVGFNIDLSAIAEDVEADGITYLWSATGGSIADSNATETTYTCGEAGAQSITIMVSDDGFEYCMDKWTVPVTCVEDGGLCENVDCDDGNECTDDACNPSTGQCDNEPVDDGTVCDGGNGMCMSGECVASPCEGVVCDDTGNECTVAECNPATGQCETSNVDDGTECDGGAGMCMGGECISDPCEGVVCEDTGNECTVAECNPASGQCETSNVADGTECDGGNGMCVDGNCFVNPCDGVVCDDTGNECTFAQCNNQTGECDVMNVPDGTECDGGASTCFDGRCIGCAADSVGDPHLITFDRRHYDLQTVGEYILARSPSLTDGFEIQARSKPWRNRRDVSINTAIAANVGGDVVSLYLDQSEIFINRVPTSVSGRVDLPEGGYVENLGSATNLVWPTGDVARIARRFDFLDLHVEAVSERCGLLVGLLGDGDGDPDNDLVPQGVTDPLAEPLTLEGLLNDFGDSWRITQEESLFEYDEGQGTEDCTDLTFPDGLTTAADLPPEVRLDAEARCRELGLTDAILLEACILDVGATGENGFLEAYIDLEPPVRTTTPWAPARVRVAHLAPEIPTAEETAVDIFIDGERSSIQEVTFGNSTEFIDLPPREYLFGIAPAGGEPIASFTAELGRGVSTTVIAIRTVSTLGTENPVGVLVFNDPTQSTPEGFGRFAAGHGADDSSITVVDGINTSACPPAVFEDLAFGSVLGPGNFAVNVEPGAVAAPDSCLPLAGPWAAPVYPGITSLAVAVDLDTSDSSPNVVGYLLPGDSEGPIPIMPFLVEEPGPDGCNVGLCILDDELRALCQASLNACLDNVGGTAREKECFLGAPVICKGDSTSECLGGPGTPCGDGGICDGNGNCILDEPELLEAPRFAPGPGTIGQAVVAPGEPVDAQISLNAATRFVRVELANAWMPGVIDTEELTIIGPQTLDLMLQGGSDDVGRYYMRVTLCGFDCNALRVIYDVLECEDPPSDVCGINGVYQRTSIKNGEVVSVQQTFFDFSSSPDVGSGTVVIQ